jgi:hypothetical protein
MSPMNTPRALSNRMRTSQTVCAAGFGPREVNLVAMPRRSHISRG